MKKKKEEAAKLVSKAINGMMVEPGKKVLLKDHYTGYRGEKLNKDISENLLETSIKNLRVLQDKLYSHNQHSILLVIQAMDAAGKDSLVSHVLSGLNPSGIKVHPFKAPSDNELEHDYLWRHNLALPARGEIGIFVRSHYENVLVTRVHPEYILGENIPGYDKLKNITKDLYRTRFRQINDWERYLTENGTTVIKLFLHSSKDEQKKQFLERIDDPSKNWKFNTADIKERQFWDVYMEAYEDLLKNTSTSYAPWYIVPSDDRWFARIAASTIIFQEFEKLKLSYPVVTDDQLKGLQDARQELLSE